MNDWLEQHFGYLAVSLISLTVLGLITFVSTLRRHAPAGEVEILPPSTVTPGPTPAPVTVAVHVVGAVIHPGAYTLPEGSRIKQAVQAAGGFTKDALRAGINLAQPLVDGQQIFVPHTPPTPTLTLIPAPTPRPTSVPESSSLAPRTVHEDRRININTATVEQLTTLPRIGPGLAQRIVAYREAHGPFRAPEDIQRVKGIGDATFEKLKDLITVH